MAEQEGGKGATTSVNRNGRALIPRSYKASSQHVVFVARREMRFFFGVLSLPAFFLSHQ